MRLIFFLFPVIAALVALTGCETLPDGEPPSGKLADNTPPPVASRLAAHNTLVTQLAAFALQENIRSMATGGDGVTAAVARDAALVAGFRITREAECRLVGKRLRDGMLELSLIRRDGSVWWRVQTR